MNFGQGKWLAVSLGLLLICLQYIPAQGQETKKDGLEKSKSASAKVDTFRKESSNPLFSSAPEKTEDSISSVSDFVLKISAQKKIVVAKFEFSPTEKLKRHFDFESVSENVKTPFDFIAEGDEKNDDGEPRYLRETAPGRGFNYRGAFTQSLLFLGVQHGYAIAGQAKTRRALKHGPFFRDYADSVKSLHGWNDGGRFFTNYIAHPMQGAFTGHVYVQNSPQALREEFSMSGKYWKTRVKAMLWTAAWSTQFEIGPISQASIGNVGLKGKQTWEDIVVTPTFGTLMLASEDAIDRYIVKAVERNTNNRYVKIFARMLLNPTRNFSNMLRFREPWYRDRPNAY